MKAFRRIFQSSPFPTIKSFSPPGLNSLPLAAVLLASLVPLIVFEVLKEGRMGLLDI